MDGPSRITNTTVVRDERYESPPPTRRVLKDSTNTAYGIRQVDSSPRKGSTIFEKENSNNENTPPHTPERKISVEKVTSSPEGFKKGGTPPRKAALDDGNVYFPISGGTTGRSVSVLGNDGPLPFDAIIGRSLLTPPDIGHPLFDLAAKGSSNELPQAAAKSSSGIMLKSLKMPKLSFSGLGIADPEAEVSQESFISEEKLSELGCKFIPEDLGANKFLSEQGMDVGDLIGTGANGFVYDIILNNNASTPLRVAAPLIYKKEKQPRLVAAKKPWRHGELSLLRLNLPYAAKTLFLIIQVNNIKNLKQFYVPADSIREYMRQISEDASVKIVGHIEPKAPGKNLMSLIEEDKNFFHPDRPHLANIIRAADDFLRAAYDSNFIHRDLKPANIMYDPASGKVTIIDAGEASRLRRRNKTDDQTKRPEETKKGLASNPEGSTSYLGTRCFMAPSVAKGREYGSEVDFFSAGMVLLNLISKDDFEKFKLSITPLAISDIFYDQIPSECLEVYLSKLGLHSETSTILEQHSYLRNIINSYFQISAINGPEKEDLRQQAMRTSKNLINELFALGSKS
ncbi:MAG: hypothetical protein ACH346_00875 [Chthoniobacterales bacterium]